MHSQLEAGLADIEGARPSLMAINPEDAQKRQIEDGQLVRVFNDRGACAARAQITTNIRPRVIAIPTGAWFDPDDDGDDRQGNPNVLTRDIGTSRLGQGSSAHSTLVQVERL